MCLITGCLRPTQTAWLPVLTNIAPPDLRRKAASDKLMTDIAAHDNWPAEVFQLPILSGSYLVIQSGQWRNTAPIDISVQWREAWESASVVNPTLLSDNQISIYLVDPGLY